MHWKALTASVLLIVVLLNPEINIGALGNSGSTGNHLIVNSKITMKDRGYNAIEQLAILSQRTDKDGDGISDDLEDKLNLTDYVNVNIVLGLTPIALDSTGETLVEEALSKVVETVHSLGGSLIHGPWKNSIVGLSARLPSNSISRLAEYLRNMRLPLFLIEEDKPVEAHNYWSNRQMNIRSYIWDELGVNGSAITVAVLDTGIDPGNTAFPQGKVVWWKDYTGDSSGFKHDGPYDDNMHGTHVSGTIAGQLEGLDGQDRLTIVFGISDMDLTGYDGYWLRFGKPYMTYFVNTTGTIELNFKWKSDTTSAGQPGTIEAVGLGYCGWRFYNYCQPTLVSSISTPYEDTWYNLTYTVSDSDYFGFYTLLFQVGTGGGVALLPIMRIPIDTQYVGGHPYLSGTAPGAKLAVAKVLNYHGSGSVSDIVSAIDDIVGSRESVEPPVYIISMSLGGGYSATLDEAVSNAVNAGLLVVASAGNDGPGTGSAASGSPSSNAYAVTVAALDSLNNVTSYSSDGGGINGGCGQVKPDLSAPGGGYVLPVLSADTSYHDDISNYAGSSQYGYWEDIDWSDVINRDTVGYDDSIGVEGTSMAAPHVSGTAALVVNALVGVDGYNWDWSSSTYPLLVKNILEISTYETYPLQREGSPAYSPTLDKGGKDAHEGYGALDAASAVELTLTMKPGEALVPGSLRALSFRDGVMINASFPQGLWSPPWGRSVYAYRVSLPYESFRDAGGNVYDTVYVFRLSIGAGDKSSVDLDLYLYRLQGDSCGDPVIIASSTQGFGSDELIGFNPSQGGDYIVAAKRAREDSMGGPAYLAVGPYIDSYALYNGERNDENITLGGEVVVEGFSAYGAQLAEVKIVDNTTGNILDTLTVNTESGEAGTSRYSITWNMPDDPSLEGHQILFITAFKESDGSIVEGPVYDTLTATGPPEPVPEPMHSALVLAAMAFLFLLIYKTRSNS